MRIGQYIGKCLLLSLSMLPSAAFAEEAVPEWYIRPVGHACVESVDLEPGKTVSYRWEAWGFGEQLVLAGFQSPVHWTVDTGKDYVFHFGNDGVVKEFSSYSRGEKYAVLDGRKIFFNETERDAMWSCIEYLRKRSNILK